MLTKFAFTVAIGLTLFFSAQSNLKAATEGATKFDGSWEATVDAKEHKNPDGSKALPWVKHFQASIKNGIFHGEMGTRGKPEFYEMNGKIGADGTASLRVDEITGSQKTTFRHRPKRR